MSEGFEQIYRKWSLPLIKFISKRTGASQLVVDEIFSQTMVAVWKSWHTFRHKSSYFTWICRISLNKIADYYRSQVNSKSTLIAPLVEDLIEPQTLSLEESLVLEELKVQVAKWLQLLPESTRQILQLRYWKDATLAEIGHHFGVSAKAAEGKLYRARKALSQIVAKDTHKQV